MVMCHRLSPMLKPAVVLRDQLATDETESHSLNRLETVYHKRRLVANFNLFNLGHSLGRSHCLDLLVSEVSLQRFDRSS